MSAQRAVDEQYMADCLALAARARGQTSPNPMVGAVVVKGGRTIARAYHRFSGSYHAERIALEEAGEQAQGATLYTNMEPCCHQGCTPPCVKAILDAGVLRVVSAIRDPDPRVDGRGLAALKSAGIKVVRGVLAARATRLNEGYLTFKRKNRPFVLGKAALTLDGRMASRTGNSQWITGEASRRRAHRLRAICDALVVGIGTVLHDNPRLTARHGGGPGPRLRVVLDSELRTPPEARLLHEDGEVLILSGASAPVSRRKDLEQVGAEVCGVAKHGGQLSWERVLTELAKREVLYAMIEGGSMILTSALDAGIIHKLMLFYAPVLIGGANSLPLWGGRGHGEIAAAPRLEAVRRSRLGSDWLIEGYLSQVEPAF